MKIANLKQSPDTASSGKLELQKNGMIYTKVSLSNIQIIKSPLVLLN